MGAFIIVIVMVAVVCLVKIITIEKQRAEQHKRFMKDFDEFDKKHKIK